MRSIRKYVLPAAVGFGIPAAFMALYFMTFDSNVSTFCRSMDSNTQQCYLFHKTKIYSQSYTQYVRKRFLFIYK